MLRDREICDGVYVIGLVEKDGVGVDGDVARRARGLHAVSDVDIQAVIAGRGTAAANAGEQDVARARGLDAAIAAGDIDAVIIGAAAGAAAGTGDAIGAVGGGNDASGIDFYAVIAAAIGRARAGAIDRDVARAGGGDAEAPVTSTPRLLFPVVL